jgi:hypothetical protein
MYDPDLDASENLARALFAVSSSLRSLEETHGDAILAAAGKVREGLMAIAEAIAARGED